MEVLDLASNFSTGLPADVDPRCLHVARVKVRDAPLSFAPLLADRCHFVHKILKNGSRFSRSLRALVVSIRQAVITT